jgi:RNA polymerase sigma-70 factor (ECF subfamily)
MPGVVPVRIMVKWPCAEDRMSGSDAISEREQVAAAIRGDVDAVRAVWQTHRRWVAAVVLAHKPAAAEVDDLLQDVAMAFVRTIGKLRDESALKPWLRTIAINAARAAGRQARLRQRQRDALAASQGPSVPGDHDNPADLTLGREDAAYLLQLAQRIPEGYREPLILRCVRGMNYRQIGKLLGLPETTIETRIARGRRMLREMLAHAGRPMVFTAPNEGGTR